MYRKIRSSNRRVYEILTFGTAGVDNGVSLATFVRRRHC